MTAERSPCPPLTDARQFAPLPLHEGAGTVTVDGVTFAGTAAFLLTASGQAIAAIHTGKDLDTQDFGTDLVIGGTFEATPFRIVCPTCFVRRKLKGQPETEGWSLISPVNGPARIAYGGQRPVTAVVAMLNNFDYGCGDWIETENGGGTRIGTPFVADLGTRRVAFRHHADHDRVKPLVEAGLLSMAPLTELTFDVEPGESDEDLLVLVTDIAALCTLAAGSNVGVAMLTLLDSNGAPVRRVIPQPVKSHYRRDDIIDDFHLPAFFRAAFGEYVRMKQAHAPWRKLANYCGSLEDAPYMEQKFASLIMALEFFMRNCLIERGHPDREVARLEFPELIGAARKHLEWEFPKHYMAKDSIRLWRNAVMHGGEWPDDSDNAAFRHLFNKWRLFLFRRILIRLGYEGKVVSPHRGYRSSSDAHDFSEEHNAFTPVDSVNDPWRQFVRHLRERQAPDSAPSPPGPYDSQRRGPVENPE